MGQFGSYFEFYQAYPRPLLISLTISFQSTLNAITEFHI
jgi:hypothetical protein